MPKMCKHPSCTFPVFGKGFCKSHQYMREDKKPQQIKPMSYKRKEREKEYQFKRKQYMMERFICEFPGCKQPSKDLHHKSGRIGANLTDVSTFMAVCREHHNYIHHNPAEAREKGFLK